MAKKHNITIPKTNQGRVKKTTRETANGSRSAGASKKANPYDTRSRALHACIQAQKNQTASMHRVFTASLMFLQKQVNKKENNKENGPYPQTRIFGMDKLWELFVAGKLDVSNSKHQRSLSQNWLLDYAMVVGSYLNGTLTSMDCRFFEHADGTISVIDGQHRLTAFLLFRLGLLPAVIVRP